MKYIDIHAHVNFKAFDEDRSEVISRALSNDTWLINVGTQIDTSKKAIEIAEQYDEGVYAIVGLHPIHTSASYHDKQELGDEGEAFTSRGEVLSTEEYKKMLMHPKVVAIGECGLDYYRMGSDPIDPIQTSAFISQIQIANEVGKPIMLHLRSGSNRSAYVDAIKILKEYSKVKGDVHFFAGSWEEAKMFLDFGFTISFTGVITFARDYDDVIKNTPLDMIMAETDCPYVTPAPYRGKRNEPVYVSEIVKKIAEIKGLDLEIVENQLAQNAKRVFGI